MGSRWAAHLTLNPANPAPSFVDDRLVTTSKRTLHFRPHASTGKADITLPIAHTTPAQCPPAKVLLVCTKSYQAHAALKQTLKHWPEPPPILLFQNGMGSQQAILDSWPQLNIYAAITTEGAFRPEPHSLVHAGLGQTIIGPLSEAAKTNGTDGLMQELAPAGLDLLAEQDVWPRLWRKLVINCAINPFTALCRCKNGEVPEQALFKQLWPELRQELQQLLQIAGMMPSQDELELMVFDVMRNTAANRSSMLQDVEANRVTEIDDINGYAARALKDAGLTHRTNQQLWEQVRALGH